MYIIYRIIRIRNSTHALRKIECNEILGIDLLEDVNKLRYIVAYYNGLTAPNDYKDGIFLLQSKSWSFNLLERPKYMTMWSLNLDQFQAFQDELQDQAKLKWIQDEEFMSNSTIKGTWIVISCTILTINTTVKIGIMATNPVSIHLNKVIDAGQIHSEDQCWGIATTVKIIQDRKIHLLPESCNKMVNITRMLARKKEQANFLYSRWSKSEQRTVIWSKLPYINISLLPFTKSDIDTFVLLTTSRIIYGKSKVLSAAVLFSDSSNWGLLYCPYMYVYCFHFKQTPTRLYQF